MSERSGVSYTSFLIRRAATPARLNAQVIPAIGISYANVAVSVLEQ